MTSRRRAPLETKELAAYLEGEVTRSELAHIEAALANDTDARRRLEQLEWIRDALSAPAPELENIDLVGRVRAAAARPPAPVRPRRRRAWLLSGALAAGVAGLFAFGNEALRRKAGSDDEFRAKSAASDDDESRWAGVRVHRVRSDGKPEPLTGGLSTGEGLLFTYSNLGPRPYAYLMIFAVSGADVYWFHPAYEHPGTNPASIPIEPGRAEVLLPDVVHHDFAPGAVSVYALFTRAPLTVLDVEAWVRARAGRIGDAKPVADASLQVIPTWVKP